MILLSNKRRITRMARTITEIKDQMTAAFIENGSIQSVYSLDPAKSFDDQFSKVSIESILFFVVASAIWVLEKLFDTHKSEVTNIINRMKPHSSKWYAEKAKAFQYGFDLLPDSDEFDNTEKTPEQIAASKIVTYSAVVERPKQLLVKAAKVVNDDLAALAPAELQAFTEYIARIKDAGVHITTLSGEPEQLKLVMTIYYNPLVLKSDGSRVDGSDANPVPDAVRDYLRNIVFDGTMVLADLVDRLQQVEGVMIPHVNSAAYKYGNLNWITFDVMHRPESGYIRIANADLSITYTAKSVQ